MYKNVKGGGRVAWLDNVKMYGYVVGDIRPCDDNCYQN